MTIYADELACPVCGFRVFIRHPSMKIVAHYNGRGSRCEANETIYHAKTKYSMDRWRHM